MNISEQHDWFDLLQDKFNAPYFIDTEKDQFINRAQVELVNDVVYRQLFPSVRGDERGPVTLSSIESSISGTEILQPLIEIDKAVATGSTSDSQIDTGDINAAIGGVSMHVLSLESNGSTFTAGRFVRFVRHNDYIRLKQNQFRAPSDRNPVYRIMSDGIAVEGGTTLSSAENFKVTVLRYPAPVSITIYSDGQDIGDATFVFTGGAAEDLWTDTAHGMSNGDRVEFTAVGTGADEYLINTLYHVIDATVNTFRLSLEPGGRVVEGTADSIGTWTLSYFDNGNSELPNFTHDKLIAISLEFAGIATRDEALKAMNEVPDGYLTEYDGKNIRTRQ